MRYEVCIPVIRFAYLFSVCELSRLSDEFRDTANNLPLPVKGLPVPVIIGFRRPDIRMSHRVFDHLLINVVVQKDRTIGLTYHDSTHIARRLYSFS